ncbi:MAG: hypothetical protein OXC46_00180 [Thaumarchaeota archaeon]|nr:hypothetical protein [Nitrososphaerota archaeon]
MKCGFCGNKILKKCGYYQTPKELDFLKACNSCVLKCLSPLDVGGTI